MRSSGRPECSRGPCARRDGAMLQRQRELVYNEFGYPTILWSVDPFD